MFLIVGRLLGVLFIADSMNCIWPSK